MRLNCSNLNKNYSLEMKNKTQYIYTIIFVSIIITTFLDMSGFIRTNDSLLFVFIAILFLIYGLYELHFFLILSKGIRIMANCITKLSKKIISFFKNLSFFNKKKENQNIKKEEKKTGKIYKPKKTKKSM